MSFVEVMSVVMVLIGLRSLRVGRRMLQQAQNEYMVALLQHEDTLLRMRDHKSYVEEFSA